MIADSWTTYVGEYKEHIAVEASTGKIASTVNLILGPILSLLLPVLAYLSLRNHFSGLEGVLIGTSGLITYLHGKAAFHNWKINHEEKP